MYYTKGAHDAGIQTEKYITGYQRDDSKQVIYTSQEIGLTYLHYALPFTNNSGNKITVDISFLNGNVTNVEKK